MSETTIVSLDALIADAAARPERYAYWLRHYLMHHADELAALRDGIS